MGRRATSNARCVCLRVGVVQESLTGQGPIEQLLVGHTNPFGDGQVRGRRGGHTHNTLCIGSSDLMLS
jgi:hypothetical protein